MDLKKVYSKFPTEIDCIKHIEAIVWPNGPICPYCKSNRHTPFKEVTRYKCNTCNMSYSVTVRTIFHKTKIDLQKWFYLMQLFIDGSANSTYRDLAKQLSVTKDTAWLMNKKIAQLLTSDGNILKQITAPLDRVQRA